MLLLPEAEKKRGSPQSTLLVEGQALTDKKSKNPSYFYPSGRGKLALGLSFDIFYFSLLVASVNMNSIPGAGPTGGFWSAVPLETEFSFVVLTSLLDLFL